MSVTEVHFPIEGDATLACGSNDYKMAAALAVEFLIAASKYCKLDEHNFELMLKEVHAVIDEEFFQ